ncbi:MAG: hypothetical protein J1E98_10710 [Lachnospiraceae bacterium]|nr:hypothetical protein [Lachnospiraceae bacterium]
MNNIVMEFVENIVNIYFCNRTIVWVIVSILSLIITIMGICYYKKYRMYAVNRIVNKVLIGVVTMFAGNFLSWLGLKPEIIYPYFNAAIFIIVIAALVFYGILKGILYMNIAPLLHLCRYIQIGCLLELFLLAYTDFLEFGEGLTGIVVIACTEIIALLIENCNLKREIQVDKESDYPNPVLFKPREKQLKNFIAVLEQQKKEPYAIMISGRWGSGKNSFVMALEEKLKEISPKDCFIWVRAGSEKSVSEIVSEISSQIMEILKKNNIYLGHEDIIENYFLAFSDLLDNKGLGFWRKIASSFVYNKAVDEKKYVNSMLEKLQGTIYIVIDDLDRCSKEYILKMFKVIRECTQLVHCKTLFLADRTKLKEEVGKDFDMKHIEKYISYTLDLCEVDYREIAYFFVQDFFREEFFQEIDATLLPNVSPEKKVESFRESICSFPLKVLERLEIEREKLKNVNMTNLSEDSEPQRKKLASLDNIIEEIQVNIDTARTVKNFFKSIKRNIQKLDEEIKKSNAEPLKEDWFHAVMDVQFLKYFSPTAFFRVQMSGSIVKYGRYDDNYGLITALGLRFDSLYNNETRNIILDYLISKLDSVDLEQIKTQEDIYLSELYSDNTELDHIDEYLRYAKKSEDFYRILDVCKSHYFANDFEKESIIGQVLEAIAKIRSPLRSESRCFLLFSQEFVRYIKGIGLTKPLREKILKSRDDIIKHTLLVNLQSFYCILTMVFRLTDVENCIKEKDIDDVNVFYDMLMGLDRSNKFWKDADEEYKTKNIKMYFINIKNEVMNIDDEETKCKILDLIHKVQEDLDVCDFWEQVIDKLEDAQEVVFRKYFILDGNCDCRDAAFESVDNIKQALSELYQFYILHGVDCISEYSLILLQMSIILIQICEKIGDDSLFEGQGKEIGELLDKAARVLYQAEAGLDGAVLNTINQIRVNVYRFKGYVKRGGNVRGIL